MRRITLSALLLLFALSRVAMASSVADPEGILRSDLDKIFSSQDFENAQWGVEVFSLDRSEKLYERNPTRLYIPASNVKILTAAVALMRLGPDFRFETRVLRDGQIADGVLKGNLVIVGSGDPSISARLQSGDPFLSFKNWAAKLKEMGVRAISGDILGDEDAFGDAVPGYGWEWNDLAQAYGAPVSALQFNENSVVLEIAPGARKGSPASIKAAPLAGYLEIENRITTAEEGEPAHIEIERGELKESIIARGAAALKGAVTTRSVAVQSPARYYLSALKHVLNEEGIDVSQCKIKEVRAFKSPSLSLLWIHRSLPLSDILKPLLKNSQNLYAETLARALGLELLGEGTFAKGKEVVENTLSEMGIENKSYSYADGSGLSRLNLASADMLLRVLISMYRHRYFPDFYSSLPIAGIDGTLAARMKGAKAENNVRAKTGSFASVCALSGYMHTAEGEMLAFSMIANNFLESKDAAEAAQDKAIERLAVFSRK
jgi:D-alanyl-D-alanine carboxypeptidase/D-alanyl-D-alanine-endopeptidase (penicillin-binding protein 4)